MIVNSTRKVDSTLKAARFRTALMNDTAVVSSTPVGAKLSAEPVEWSFIRPLANFGRALRVLANEAIDASRGRYDR